MASKKGNRIADHMLLLRLLLLLLPLLIQRTVGSNVGLTNTDTEELTLLSFRDIQSGSPPFPQAAAAFEELARRDPHDSFAFQWLGRLRAAAGDLAGSEEALEAALATNEARLMADDETERFTRRVRAAQLSRDLALLRASMRLGPPPPPMESGAEATRSGSSSTSSGGESSGSGSGSGGGGGGGGGRRGFAGLFRRPRLKAKGSSRGGSSSGGSGGSGGPLLSLEAIPRVHHSQLAGGRLAREFLGAGRSVVVTGLSGGPTPGRNWTARAVAAACGGAAAPLKVHDAAGRSDAWAGMLDAADTAAATATATTATTATATAAISGEGGGGGAPEASAAATPGPTSVADLVEALRHAHRQRRRRRPRHGGGDEGGDGAGNGSATVAFDLPLRSHPCAALMAQRAGDRNPNAGGDPNVDTSADPSDSGEESGVLAQAARPSEVAFRVPALVADVVSFFGPSLFVQGPGSRCSVHVDGGATHFWQFVSQGRKRWRVWQEDPLMEWVRFHQHHHPQQVRGAVPAAFFPDVRCSGIFGEEAKARATNASAGACGEAGSGSSSSSSNSSSSSSSSGDGVSSGSGGTSGSKAGGVRSDDDNSAPSWTVGPPDPFDDAALEAWLQRRYAPGARGMVVHEAMVGAGDLIIIPANAPHAVMQPPYENGGGDDDDDGGGGGGGGDDDDDGAMTVAVSMNFVDASNLALARDAALASPAFHPRFRARLRKEVRGGEADGAAASLDAGGNANPDGAVARAVAVPASQARWYEQFRIPVLDEATDRLEQLAAAPPDDLAAALSRAQQAASAGLASAAGGVSYFEVPWDDLVAHRLTHEQTRLPGGQVR